MSGTATEQLTKSIYRSTPTAKTLTGYAGPQGPIGYQGQGGYATMDSLSGSPEWITTTSGTDTFSNSYNVASFLASNSN